MAGTTPVRQARFPEMNRDYCVVRPLQYSPHATLSQRNVHKASSSEVPRGPVRQVENARHDEG